MLFTLNLIFICFIHHQALAICSFNQKIPPPTENPPDREGNLWEGESEILVLCYTFFIRNFHFPNFQISASEFLNFFFNLRLKCFLTTSRSFLNPYLISRIISHFLSKSTTLYIYNVNANGNF